MSPICITRPVTKCVYACSHTQLDVATAELDIYKEKFTSGERQLKEAQTNLKETTESIKDKQK